MFDTTTKPLADPPPAKLPAKKLPLYLKRLPDGEVTWAQGTEYSLESLELLKRESV